MKKVMGSIKWHFEHNELFRACYPEYCPMKGVKWGTLEDFVVPNRTTNVTAPTLMIGSEHSPSTGFHFDLVINDDLHNEENTYTSDQVQKVIENWQNQGPIMRIPGKATKRIQIGTIWDFADVNIHVMRVKAPNFYKVYKDETYKHPKNPLADNFPGDTAKVYILSCYTDDYGVTTDRQPTWKEAYPLDELERFRKEDCVSTGFFNMQMRNKVITDETRSFRPGWFKYFQEDVSYPALGERRRMFVIEGNRYIPEEEIVMRMTIDPAYKVKVWNDSTGFVIAGHWYDYENTRRYILVFDAFAEKLEPNDLIRRIDDECAKWGILELGIEVHGLQFLFTDQLIEKTRNSWIGVNQVELVKINRGSEAIVGKARVLRLVPFYERGQIYHAEHLIGSEFERQLMSFSGKMYRGKSPDIADAMSDQIDFPIAGGVPSDPGNPRYKDHMLHGRDRVLERAGATPWDEYLENIRNQGDINDWKRR